MRYNDPDYDPNFNSHPELPFKYYAVNGCVIVLMVLALVVGIAVTGGF